MILVGDIRQAGLTASLIRRNKPVTEEIKQRFLYGRLNMGSFINIANVAFSSPA
jgi:hypothetical protein